MGQTTGISWTDHTFNPWIGCAKVHAGCANCYAERDFDNRRKVVEWGQHGTRVKTSEPNWKQPLNWNREAEAARERRRVFCASLADVFEDWPGTVRLSGNDLTMCCATCGFGGAMPIIQRQLGPPKDQCPRCEGTMVEPTLHGLRSMLFSLIDSTPWLDWLLLTKRPENVLRMWPCAGTGKDAGAVDYLRRDNVWLGTSVSDQETAERMIPSLLKCRDLSPVLFLSVEPLLGSLTFRWAKWQQFSAEAGGSTGKLDGLRKLDWIIAGGESGPTFRQMMIDDVRRLRDQCTAAGVPFFFKQWSGANPKTQGKQLDGREWCEFPNVKVSI